MTAKQQRARALTIALVAMPIALTACQRQSDDRNLNALDSELADRNNAAGLKDPAVVNALQGEIMVDPELAQQANRGTIRPPSRPYSAPVPPDSTVAGNRAPVDASTLRHAPAADGKGCPQCRTADGALTLGALAARQRDRKAADCAANIQYSNGWATRLPRDVPLYPDARVTEAAGNAANGCTLRVVSFATAAPLQTVIDWYYTQVVKVGFTAEHQADGTQHVLGGTRAKDGGAYILYLSPRTGGGTDVDLVTNNGV